MRNMLRMLGIFLCSALCCGTQAEAQQPVWTVDLADHGKQAIETPQQINPLDQDSGVAFLDDGTVVAHFLVRAAEPGLSVRGATSQTLLRAVLLDPASGARLAMQDWPAELLSSSFVPAAGGKFVVLGAAGLQLYSRDLELISQVRLPAPERYEERHLRISPSGTVLWLARFTYREKSGTAIQRYDTRSLAPLSGNAEDQSLRLDFSASDDSIAQSFPQVSTRIMLRDAAGKWHPLLEHPPDQWCVGDPVFVDNNQLLVVGCRHVMLVTINGKVLLDEQIEKAWDLEATTAISRNGRFAAVSMMSTRDGAFDPAIHRSTTKVVVYDLVARRPIYEVEIAPLPQSSYSYALAPDGSALAVMTDSLVKLYRIPEQGRNGRSP